MEVVSSTVQPENSTTVIPASTLKKPKWDSQNNVWVEGAEASAQQEFNAQVLLQLATLAAKVGDTNA
ncbi:hypothetical protein IV36_GL001894 [Liquorilactobacillus mali]|uniref:Uncharacterized protein n=2 Tax=Liquorilactobacillus mali TaxID=1618 RepID=A0A0R2FRI8_9LACO|nr:hypothetical protein IV36_GL001894 [Liquorilactobacillus mali]